MPDERKPQDPGSLWRSQAGEGVEMMPSQFVRRRAREIESKTCWEIVMSVGAAVFFVAFITWRFGFPQDRAQRLVLALAVAWMLASIYLSRHRIWRRKPMPPDAAVTTGLEYYRKRLEDRRDHLKREWLWHGPVLLACLLFFQIIFGNRLPSPERLLKTLPFVVLLGVWIVVGAWQRWRMAKEIQREIDELNQT